MQDDKPDLEAICGAITDKTRLIHIQRSCGYSSVRKNAECSADRRDMRSRKKRLSLMLSALVDNCYGEFIEKTGNPRKSVQDLIAGSLIKKIWGGGFCS